MTRVMILLACGCTRRMPRATTERMMNTDTPVRCTAGHGQQLIAEIQGQPDIAALLQAMKEERQ